MSEKNTESLDVAIIGGGVSGVYTAWRLAESLPAGSSIALFEASNRIGGRLWSVELEDEQAIPAELGGMFFSDAQSLVYNLITGVLDLETENITPSPDFAYLRAKRFRISEFADRGVPPYRLANDEEGKSYHELLFLALRRIVPELDQYWPLAKSGSPEELVRHLRTVQFEGRALHQWGFWNLISKVLSNEAYLCLRDLVGSFAMFSNWNGYDATLSLLWDLTGKWYRLPNGYETLPRRLSVLAAEKKVRIEKNSEVIRIAPGQREGTVLTVESKGGTREIESQSTILALPKRAITNIEWDFALSADGAGMSELAAIEGVPACKIFLTFDDPWWRRVPEGPGKIADGTFALSHTDLPMRQCYYLGVDPSTGEGLFLASYSDANAVPFWSSLISEDGRPSGLSSTVSQAARSEVRRQLSEMHGISVPEPTGGIFVNWSSNPYGGGWHAWLPGWRSYEVMATLRRPIRDRNIHICGEVSCAYEGWVEGALTSAEVMLQEQFDLENPDWLSTSHTLSPYRT